MKLRHHLLLLVLTAANITLCIEISGLLRSLSRANVVITDCNSVLQKTAANRKISQANSYHAITTLFTYGHICGQIFTLTGDTNFSLPVISNQVATSYRFLLEP